MRSEPPESHDEHADAERPGFNPLDALGLFSRGLAMGAADIVPGVSGGTIAFISGIYERFVNALRSLSLRFLAPAVRGRPRDAFRELLRIHWAVLIPLFLGIVAAVATMSGLISGLMEDHPGPTYAFFFGLIIATTWIPFARMTQRRAQHFIALAVFAVGAFLFVGLQPDGLSLRLARAEEGAATAFYAGKIRHPADLDSIRSAAAGASSADSLRFVVFDPKGILDIRDPQAEDASRLTVLDSDASLEAWLADRPPLILLEEARAPLPWILGCGMIAISAMILPGLSGSFLLLFLGQYHAVLGAIKGTISELLMLLGREPDPLPALLDHPWWSDPLFLGVFLVGVVIGLGVFSHIVGWLFEHRHDITMAALTGLLIGALRQPGQVVLEQATVARRLDGGASYWTQVAIAAIVGAIIVTGLNYLDARLRSRRSGAVDAS